ncbi:hypothetical protein INR49_013954 [Caranx melampygus]|nr:hypothetical protein INR49_013954 [Caranx melampygus]
MLITRPLLQPVALNILRSKGSPDSSPSILVSEWQDAMQATKAELTRLSLAASDSGGNNAEELEDVERIQDLMEEKTETQTEDMSHKTGVRYLSVLHFSKFPMMLLLHSTDAVVSVSIRQLSSGLQIQAVEGFLPRSQHHRRVCAGALDAPLGQPIEQQQQEPPRANSTHAHQDPLPQTGPVAPHLLHMDTVMSRDTTTYRCLLRCVTWSDVALSDRRVESLPGWTWCVQPVDTSYLSNMCLQHRAADTHRRSTLTLRWNRTVPNRSIQKEVGKTGCEVIRGHSVWAEFVQVATNREKCSDMCAARHVCSGWIMVGTLFGDCGMFSCGTGVISELYSDRPFGDLLVLSRLQSLLSFFHGCELNESISAENYRSSLSVFIGKREGGPLGLGLDFGEPAVRRSSYSLNATLNPGLISDCRVTPTGGIMS